MSLNFLVNKCREAERTDLLFGLCDDQDGKKAYSNTDDQTKWIATVKNNKALALVFTPIDNCIIQKDEYPGRGRCDGMLTSAEHIYFVELKDIAKGWITDTIDQLESTIEFFKENHDINTFRHKKAFACNKHRHFQAIDNEFNLAFFRKHRVRIDIQAEILII
ncbi:MAG: hypothetical protein M0R39_10150 [Prolixibacteraceae bacterium]|nr:hypothetical protein [Prolixibacteraceae bacterium]